MRFVMILAVILTAGCGSPSTERFESLSSCRAEAPVDLQGAVFGATPIVLKDALFQTVPGSKAADMVADQKVNIRLFQIQVGGNAQADMLGMDLTPDRTAGFQLTYPATTSESTTDEEGFRHLYPPKRNLAGKVKNQGGITQYTTSLTEKAILNDKMEEVQNLMITGLRVLVENEKIIGLEVNWPVTKEKVFRLGEFLQPRIDMWLDQKNETLCLKSASLTR